MRNIREVVGVKDQLRALKKEGQAIEIRILNTNRGTVSGYYTDLEKLERDIAPYEGNHNIFFTLNPVTKEVMARANNRLIQYAKNTTTDSEIERRHLFLVDIDPKRITGVSSTDDELEEARKVSTEIKNFLTTQGFPHPIVALSGNGYHLLYRLNLPNTNDINNIIKDTLEVLHLIFSNSRAEVDCKVFNLARICKLYGTTACKGDNIPERPHRKSGILEVPDEFECVPEELFRIVGKMKPRKEIDNDIKKNSNFLNVSEWLDKHNIEVHHKKESGNSTIYVLEKCPWREEHDDKSAFVVQFHNGAISAGCHHNSCSEENWHTLRSKYEPQNIKKKSNKATKEEQPDKKSQADIIIELAIKEGDILFHNELQEPHVAIQHEKFNEVMKLEDKSYRLLLTKRFYNYTGKSPSRDAITQAMAMLEAKALFEGELIELSKRCAYKDNSIYYDLGDKNHTFIKITENGWEIDENKIIIFIRKKNMKSQVMPEVYNDLSILDKHYRFQSEDDRLLHKVNIITKFIPFISHPIDVIYGEKGASKTTSMRKDRDIVDPAIRPIISMPKTKDELALTLSNNYMPCFDNLDNISAEKSDILCIASTGGGFSRRTLYTNDEETIYQFKVPVMLNGINVVATRPDLLDRAILLGLERISEEERREETIIWREFENDKPKILGAIFTILSKAMKIVHSIELNRLPRMADYAKWGYAVAEAAGLGGENFIRAYSNNQNRANQEALESNPTAFAMIKLMEECENWQGSVRELLEAVNFIAERENIDTTSKLWPKEPNILSRRLNEIKSNLQIEGIYFDIRHRSSNKEIEIVKKQK